MVNDTTGIPETMTAVGFHEHGSVDNYQLLDVETPQPAADEVLVDVKATALNHMDLFAVRELDHYVPEYPFWGGGDIAGAIAAVGEDIREWSVGDRVVVDPYIPEGVYGEHRKGGFAEYVTVPEEQLIVMPDSAEYVESAAVPIAGGTAWEALAYRGDLKPYDELLIVGGTGGVGTFAVQIATDVFNVKNVYATTSTEEKADFLYDLGVDHVINYTEEDFDQRIWELTDGQGVDIAYDNVGGPAWTKSLRSLREHGRLVTSGATAGPNPETELRLIFIRRLDVRGSSGARNGGLEEALEYVWSGELEPIIESTYALEDYDEALRRMAGRDLLGKVVLTQE